MVSASRCAVRDLGPAEIGIRICYFHEASDEHLARMGVDRALLPPPDEWAAWYAADMAKPPGEVETATVGWYLDDEIVGFSSIDRITPGASAFFHLHVLDADRRQRGLGRRFVPLAAARLMARFDLQRLFSEPNAYNRAPNRTLQAAGFRYLFTHDATPGRINPPQAVTRWVLERDDLPRADP